MKCKHSENDGYWKQDRLWFCHDCSKELKPHYFCRNCETDEWIDCNLVEMTSYSRFSGEQIVKGKTYPTHITIPLDEYTDLHQMLYKLLRKKPDGIRELADDVWAIIEKVEDLKYGVHKEKSK